MRWVMTARGLRRWAIHSFAAFGVAALLLQSYQAIWDRPLWPGHAGQVAAAVAIASVLYGLVRTRPAKAVVRDLRRPGCRIEVVPGDLFEQDESHLVIGFTDTFDTDVTDDRVVQAGSVQGQFLRRVYDGDQRRLDAELEKLLAAEPVVAELTRATKPYGKLRRHLIGTVLVLGDPRRHFFAVAYSRMGPNLVAQSSADQLWQSLSRLWAAVHEHGQRRPVAMPVVGATLARVDALDREALLRLILLSFVAASRDQLVTTRLRVVLRPDEFAEVNRAELQAFLDSI
ncbi:hypothetical protein GCM10023107_09710 [Actinoplanes octamycinicus]|nr:hypothetical protein Aoc01nite_81410 [Actinoplanes octamycinicus]